VSHLPTRRPPAIGDIAPDCVLPELDGTTVSLREDAIAGNPIVLVFCPKSAPSVAQALSEFKRALRRLCRRRRATFRGNARTSQGCRRSGDPLCDPARSQAGRLSCFGATQEITTAIVPRPNHHVIAILNGAARSLALNALEVVETLAAVRKPAPMPTPPPVLIVPDVLGREDCLRLITIYDTRGKVLLPHGPGLDHLAGSDYKMRVPEHSRQDRINHFIFSPPACFRKSPKRSTIKSRVMNDFASGVMRDTEVESCTVIATLTPPPDIAARHASI
jgi:hypothetical protein